MSISREDVAARIRQFAENKKLKLKDLAALLNMTPSALNAGYLTGRSIPGPEILIKFHNMGCSIVWLLTGEGKPDREDKHGSITFYQDEHGNKFNFKSTLEELADLKAENAAFRSALSAEMVDMILKKAKKGK